MERLSDTESQASLEVWNVGPHVSRTGSEDHASSPLDEAAAYHYVPGRGKELYA